MRGKGVAPPEMELLHGITPAHAGKSEIVVCASVPSEDHPRTCGEKRLPVFSSHSSTGSPPHMRGKVDLLPLPRGRIGITPAHAVKRKIEPCCTSYSRDHPRTCGEKPRVLIHIFHSVGSPPHMRGKAQVLGAEAHGLRITPAHAGKRT